MSGHSKWATIKRKKALIDAKRGKAFSQLTKEISIAARAGGDPAANSRLRLLMEKAKEINMPLDNVMRAIKRGTGELPGVHYEEQSYEGYGPHGIALIIAALTDNKNRTVAEFRRLFLQGNGSLGETGSVNWMFSKMGVLRGTAQGKSEDDMLEALIEHDIQNITLDEEGNLVITCDPKSLDEIKKVALQKGVIVESSEIEWVAQNPVTLSQEETDKVYEFLTSLQEHDDVQHVYTNLAQ